MKYAALITILIVSVIFCSAQTVVQTSSTELFDTIRNRHIPIIITNSSEKKGFNLPLVVINHGYGIKNTDYSFIAKRLAGLGYFVVSIQHDLPSDEPLARTGNIYELRKPVWERGIENINFVISSLEETRYFSKLILIGHSNGGDIAMLFATLYPNKVSKVISLDNLRMPIPRLKSPGILSIRATDTQADEGVMPSLNEQIKDNIKIVALKNGKHSDLCDQGTDDLKQEILTIIEDFLTN
jgi:dienelactone hydrolase